MFFINLFEIGEVFFFSWLLDNIVPMFRILKIFFLVIVSFLVLAVLSTYIFLPPLMNTSWAKEKIALYIKESTGRSVSVGELLVRLGLTPTIEIKNFSLRDDKQLLSSQIGTPLKGE